jgi:hypothetical protein
MPSTSLQDTPVPDGSVNLTQYSSSSRKSLISVNTYDRAPVARVAITTIATTLAITPRPRRALRVPPTRRPRVLVSRPRRLRRRRRPPRSTASTTPTRAPTRAPIDTLRVPVASASSPRVHPRARRRASTRCVREPTPSKRAPASAVVFVDASLVDARLASSDDALETETSIASSGLARASRVISRRTARRRRLRNGRDGAAVQSRTGRVVRRMSGRLPRMGKQCDDCLFKLISMFKRVTREPAL